jgi:hypothetical protein
MLKLMYRTIGLSFYQQHAGLFLVVLYLLFGAVEGSQLLSYHKAILMAICSSPIVLLSLFAVWMLYALKTFFFVKKKLIAEDYRFLTSLTTISKKKQHNTWTKLYGFLLLPILIYAVLILINALRIGAYFTLFFTIFGLPGMLAVLGRATFRISNFTFIGSKTWINMPQTSIKRPFWSWPIFYLINEQRVMVLIVKVVSVFFFKAVLFMFADVGNDVRVYQTAILAVVLSHAILVFNLIKFHATYLAFTKALPIVVFKTLRNSFVAYFLILLPEFILLAWLMDFSVLNLASCILFGVAMMMAIQLIVYMINANMERYLQYLLFFFFVSMMSILAGYAIVFSLMMLTIATLYFLWRYPRTDLKMWA